MADGIRLDDPMIYVDVMSGLSTNDRRRVRISWRKRRRRTWRRDVRLRFAGLINVLVENAKTTHGKLRVQFHGHTIRAHDVRLGGSEVAVLVMWSRFGRMMLLLRHAQRHFRTGQRWW